MQYNNPVEIANKSWEARELVSLRVKVMPLK